jgi:hypothetical protein
VTVWDTHKYTRTAIFHVDSTVMLSPDASRLALLSDRSTGDYKFFDISTKHAIQRTGHEDLDWVPHLGGILISWMRNKEHGDYLLGRFIDCSHPFPILLIPRDVDIWRLAVGPSMFALGCGDGRVLMGRAATTPVRLPHSKFPYKSTDDIISAKPSVDICAHGSTFNVPCMLRNIGLNYIDAPSR